MRRLPLVFGSVGALVYLLPLAALVAGSLRPRGLPPAATVDLLPDDPTLQAYGDLFRLLPFDTYLLTSLLVALLAVPVAVVSSAGAGFAIRCLSTRLRILAITVTVAVMTVPASALWTPRFAIYRSIGAIDSLLPLIAPAIVSPFLVLVYTWAFHRLDDDVLDAAAVDGASLLRTFWSVALPMVRPATSAVVVLSFAAVWGDVVSPLLYTSSQATTTAPRGLQLLTQLNPTDFPLLLAGAVVVTVAPVVVFLGAQRAFLSHPERLEGTSWR